MVKSLPELIQDSRTCRYFLSKLVQGKLEKVENPLKVTKSMTTLDDHTETVYSSLYYLILESSKVQEAECLHAASHMGKGVGLTLLLKSIPEDARNEKIYLPTDLCLKSKLVRHKCTIHMNEIGELAGLACLDECMHA